MNRLPTLSLFEPAPADSGVVPGAAGVASIVVTTMTAVADGKMRCIFAWLADEIVTYYTLRNRDGDARYQYRCGKIVDALTRGL